MVETARRWQLNMLMSQGNVQNQIAPRTNLWADSVPIILHQVQLLVTFVGINNLIIAHTEKVASAMEY